MDFRFLSYEIISQLCLQNVMVTFDLVDQYEKAIRIAFEKATKQIPKNMSFVVPYPENTKDATAERKGNTLVVPCPHCGCLHYHPFMDSWKAYVESHCKMGYYVIKIVTLQKENDE